MNEDRRKPIRDIEPSRYRSLYFPYEGMRRKSGFRPRDERLTKKPWTDRFHFFHTGNGAFGKYRMTSPWHPSPSVYKRIGVGRPKIICHNQPCRSVLTRERYRGDGSWNRIDFSIYVHALKSYTDQERVSYESEMSCWLDGTHFLDLVATNEVEPLQVGSHWECGDCMKTGDPNAEPGYVRASFDTLDALLMDHLEPTLKGMAYLVTASHVRIDADCPADIEKSGTAVWLDSDCRKIRKRTNFLIRIGRVYLCPLESTLKANPVAQRMHEMLVSYQQNLKQNAQNILPQRCKVLKYHRIDTNAKT